MANERVTVTLSRELVEAIDRTEPNRSRFIREAVRHELDRRRREAVRRSLRSPHPESRDTAELGFGEWAAGLPETEDGLLDPKAGTEVQWRPGRGWVRIEGSSST